MAEKESLLDKKNLLTSRQGQGSKSGLNSTESPEITSCRPRSKFTRESSLPHSPREEQSVQKLLRNCREAPGFPRATTRELSAAERECHGGFFWTHNTSSLQRVATQLNTIFIQISLITRGASNCHGSKHLTTSTQSIVIDLLILSLLLKCLFSEGCKGKRRPPYIYHSQHQFYSYY